MAKSWAKLNENTSKVKKNVYRSFLKTQT